MGRQREVKTLRLSPPPTEFPFVDPESEVCFCNGQQPVAARAKGEKKEAVLEERARKRQDRKLERLRMKEIKRVKKERKARRKLNINETHNYLYCEYVTGMMTYFDLRVDPHQLRNLLHTLTDTELNFMHSQVLDLRSYSAEQRFLERRRRVRKLQEEEKKRRRWNRRKNRRMERFLPSPKGYRRRG